MKTQQPILTTSIEAMVDLTRYRFAGFDGNVCAAGAKALGPVEANTAAGNMAPVNVLGIALVEAAGTINAGAEVQSDANGCAIPKASGSINGIAMDAATGAGDIIRIVRGI